MLTHLKDIGLSDNEAKVYLAMLELGPAPVAEIAAKAGVNRPTAYLQIESLKKMGLANIQHKNKKTLYAAESPEQLGTLLEKQRFAIETKEKEIKKIFPELEKLFQSYGARPNVRLFEDKDVIERIRQEVLKSKEKTLRAIFSLDEVHSFLPDETREKGSEARVQKKIFSKAIYTSSQGDILKKNDEVRLRESKYVPPDKLNISFDLTIFDDTVAITSFKKKLFCTVIKHKEIAESFKNLFDLIWEKI